MLQMRTLKMQSLARDQKLRHQTSPQASLPAALLRHDLPGVRPLRLLSCCDPVCAWGMALLGAAPLGKMSGSMLTLDAVVAKLHR